MCVEAATGISHVVRLSKRGKKECMRQNMGTTDDYSDIIDLEHPTSRRHPRMAAEMRAAQFAPFAALTGYEEAIEETAMRQQAEVLERDAMRE